MKKNSVIPVERITGKIFLIRKEKVMLDSDLAELYGVQTKVLIQAVKRNYDRFPDDFMFQIKGEEFEILRSQIVTSKRGGRRYPPYVFTEQGVAMLSSVLNSKRAVQVNIAIMRAFVQLRRFLQSNEDLSKRLKKLESETKKKFADQEEQIQLIFEAIKELIIEKEKPKTKFGFQVLNK
jgi:phage regulator Rha-like protein